MVLLGITGTDGAGKGAVVDYLVEKRGFTHCSARAIWIEEIERQGIENNRANMRLVANELRAKHGYDYLITYYLQKIAEEKPEQVVIESLRARAEAETLKANGGILLVVDADQQLRYERIQGRKSSSDQITFEEFVGHEELEMDDPDPAGMQKAKVIEMADHVIQNNSSLEELHKQIDAIMVEIKS